MQRTTQSRQRSAGKSRKRFIRDSGNERARSSPNKTVGNIGPAGAQQSIATQMRLRRRAWPSGECEECSKKKRLGLQTKLKVNEPGDIYEQEADRIADQVMATPAHPAVSGAPPRIQRFSGQPNGQMDAAPASVDQALASPGRPLEPALRQDMEQRFGHDFSRVRVHSDAAAEQSARDVNAHAYTVGHNIVFGAGQFAPGTRQGRRLIAHEVTHVIQQAGEETLVQRAPANFPSNAPIGPQPDPKATEPSGNSRPMTGFRYLTSSDAVRPRISSNSWPRMKASFTQS